MAAALAPATGAGQWCAGDAGHRGAPADRRSAGVAGAATDARTRALPDEPPPVGHGRLYLSGHRPRLPHARGRARGRLADPMTAPYPPRAGDVAVDELLRLMDEVMAAGAIAVYVKWTCPRCGDRVVADAACSFHPEGYTHTTRADGTPCGHLYVGPKW